MRNLGFLAGAYALVWIALGAYLFSIVRRQRRLEARLDQVDQLRRDHPESGA